MGRRRSPGWVPNQHGAWAMLVLPLAVGALRAGPEAVHLWLLVAWLVAYLAFFATGLWLRSARKARYRPPVIAYAGAAGAVGLPLLVAEPELVRWGVVYAPLLVVSLGYSARRAERALANDLVTIVAASLMAVVAYGVAHDDGAWLRGTATPTAWVLAAAVCAYLAGTAFYVKTMIRERGNPAMYRWSVGYHATVAAAFAVVPGVRVPAVAAFLAVMAVKAAVVPRRWPRLRPAPIGAGEVVASVLLATILALVSLNG